MNIPWYENDKNLEEWSSVIFNSWVMAETSDDVDNVITLLDIKPGDNILDLCCGIGRHSLELARRGFQVTGVDRMHTYLEKARESADQDGLSIEFVKDDMRQFCHPETYDAIINMYTSFSYFEDPEEDRQVVLNAYNSLRKGGALLIQMYGKETFARIFRERDWVEIDGKLLIMERKITNNWGWLENKWILIDGDKRLENNWSHRFYSGTEIYSLVKNCGFSHVYVYGDLSGNPYDHTAQGLVTVGIK